MTQIDNRESGLSVRTKLNELFETAASAVQPADIGTAAPLDVPAGGDAAAGEVVKGDDTRLSDARTPTAHTHVEADITDLGNYQVVLTEGAFVDGDKTKLDGIEALADVTDTANVTAAGALMDGEVTNLPAVKSFDPADYATAAHTHTKSDITDFNETDYATGAEGDLAATALQPGDAVEQTSATGSAVLPVGTTAQRDGTPATGYLRYNSTDGSPEVYDGAEWVPVGGGGGGSVYITSSDLSGDATADFTAFDATKYDAYEFVLQNVIPATDKVVFYARTSSDGGVNFDTDSSDYNDATVLRDKMILSDGNVGNSNSGVSCSVTVYGPHLAQATHMSFYGSFADDGSGLGFINSYAKRNASEDVNAIRFFFSSGNIASGTITMYGKVNA